MPKPIITLDLNHWEGVISLYLEHGLKAEFPNIYGVFHDNDDYDAPETTNNDEASSWFFIEIHAVDSAPVEMGKKGDWRIDGNVYVKCRTPNGIGKSRARSMASAASKLTRGTDGGYVGLRFDAPWASPVRAENFYQITVTCPFYVRAPRT